MPIIVADVAPQRRYRIADTGNYNPAYVPDPSSYIYVDLNAPVNGTGLSALSPRNTIPGVLASGAQLLFNSDNGIQNIPTQDVAVSLGANINDVQISSYGSGTAVLCGYQYFTSGWTLVGQAGASTVWKRVFAGVSSAAGPEVGNVVDMTSTAESPQGDILNWYNLEDEGNKIGAFLADPTVLPVGSYAYDYTANTTMYINVGSIGGGPNGRTIGIGNIGYMFNGGAANSPTRVRIHNLRFIGFVKQAINILGSSSFWKIDNNSFYGCGGMYNATQANYLGGCIQMSHTSNNIEIANNVMVQTWDSPISPQHFGGSTGGNLHDIFIHHNTITKWALAAVEMSDFGSGNQFSNITIEDNICLKGGQGYNTTGDSPQGFTDGIQVRAAPGTSGVFNNLSINRNQIQTFNNGFCIIGTNGTFGSPVTLNDNIFSECTTGVNNVRPAVTVFGNRNTFCGDATNISDASATSLHQNSTIVSGGCLGATFNYYISPTGSDANPGTFASPWAITSLNTKRATYAGKTVGLMDGTYSVYAILTDGAHLDQDAYALNVEGGTAGSPTIIKAVNARQAIITGKSGTTYGSNQGSPMIGHQGETTNRGYVTFDGLKLTGTTRLGIRVGRYGLGAQIPGITVKNCEFTDFNGLSATPGLNLTQLELNRCTGHLVQNNYFHDNIGYAAASPDHLTSALQWESDRGTYEYNTIENSGGIMGKISGQYGQTFRYNYIDVSSLSISDASSLCLQDFSGYAGSPATTTSVHHNVLIGGAGWDFRDVLDNAQFSRDLIQVYNNTIRATGPLVTRGLQVKATAGQGSIYNNIIQDDFNGDHTAVAYNKDIDGICDYNCYYNSLSDLQLSYFATAGATSFTTVTTIAAFRTATGAEAHSITTIPSFTGVGNRATIYTLNGGGCVGTGKSTGLVGGVACDMGAWGNNPPARIGCDFAPAPATIDYYISTTGSDANPGTLASPWAITALNTKRTTYTGKTVGLLDGTYSIYAMLNDGTRTTVDVWALDVDGGTAGAPTIIKSVNPRGAIITGKSGSNYGNASQPSNPGTPMLGHSGTTTHKGYVTFDGLKITGCPRMGIRIGIQDRFTPANISGITIKNCEFYDFDGRALSAGLNLSMLEFNNCTGHLIQNNYFHDGIGYAIGSGDHYTSTLQWSSDHGTYEYNTIENSSAIYAKEDGQFGNIIRYNYINMSSITTSHACIQDFNSYVSDHSATTSIHHNILIGKTGIDLRNVLDDSVFCLDLVQIYNNTCDLNDSAAGRGILFKAGPGNGSIYNNIVRDASTGDHSLVAYNVNVDGIADYNCYRTTVNSLLLGYYASQSATVRNTVATIAAFRTQTGAEAHSITTDPSFVGAGSRATSYVLNGGGCVGTGKSTGLIGGTACDMGAWGNSPPTRIGADFAQ